MPGGYTRDEVVVAGGLDPNAIDYRVKPRVVARLHVYADPALLDSRIPEQPTQSVRRSVRFSRLRGAGGRGGAGAAEMSGPPEELPTGIAFERGEAATPSRAGNLAALSSSSPYRSG